jgi:large subunit ribosomal protein L21
LRPSNNWKQRLQKPEDTEERKMYAVIKTGGKQYRVQAGDKVRVEKLDTATGKTIKITDVLMLVEDDKIKVGNPFVKGATVSAKINAHGRSPKINVLKFIRRKHHLKQMGHRQSFTELSILDIKTK